MLRPELFAQAVTAHRPVLLAYARRALLDPQEAEDALQAALVRAMDGLARFVEGTNLRAYLFAYLVGEVQNLNRRRRPAPLEPAQEPEDEGLLQALELESAYEAFLEGSERLLEQLGDEVVAALSRLSEAEREVLLLRSIGELKYAEIAHTLRVPLGTVMSHLHRARARLRRALVDLAIDRGFLPRTIHTTRRGDHAL
jgi:RNA polymerase sigma-70 factor (ECF subfamily)